MVHTVYIDLVAEAARVSASLTQLPSVRLKHLTDESIAFAFMTSGTVAEITDYEADSGRVVIKKTSRGDVLLQDVALVVSGSGTSARYTAAWAAEEMDSPALTELMGDTNEDVAVVCEVLWKAAGKTYRVAFEITIAPAYNLETDGAPETDDPASETWLDARAPRINKARALTDAEREQLLDNIGDLFRGRLSEDEAYMHHYTPAGVYVGSVQLVDLSMPNLT